MLASDAMRCEWDTSNAKQSERYKSLYLDARANGRKILSPSDKGKQLSSFREALLHGGFTIGETELADTQFAMRMFNQTGDTRLIWDYGRPKEVQEAAKLFNDHIEKGYRAYAIDPTGRKTSRRLYGFDPVLQEIFLDDKKTVKEHLGEFVKAFKEIKLTPKTMPG